MRLLDFWGERVQAAGEGKGEGGTVVNEGEGGEGVAWRGVDRREMLMNKVAHL